MVNFSVDVKGFSEVTHLIKKLPDNVKNKEVLKILGQVANPTVKAAKNLAPQASGFVTVRSKSYKRKKRQVRRVVVEEEYTVGHGKKSIGKKAMLKARVPMLVVKPKDITIGGKRKYGGFYVRQFVILGTKNIKANPFIDRAYAVTKGKITKDAEKRMARYLSKQIKRLKK